jgi:acetamidase/formamidase
MPGDRHIPVLSVAYHDKQLAPGPEMIHLPATPATCQWGVIDRATPPVLSVPSGAVVEIDAVTHHSGDAPDLLMDDGVRALWAGIPVSQRGPGVHILTGPVDVEGAVAGGALAVQILSMAPRFRYGSNCAANWGLLHHAFGKERITIYELEETAGALFPRLARPHFAFDFTGRPLYDVPGFVSEPDPSRREPFSRDVRIPVRPHLGVLGVAPEAAGRHSSIPPGNFGGNVDNWRFGPGSTIFLPVFKDGAGLYVGDPHFAQGDGEVCGTAIEASASATVRITAVDDLHITSPVLETDTHWYTHGFGDDLDAAMVMAVELMLKLLRDKTGLSADDAYSVASVAMDLGVTQVVDTVVGCHAAIPLSLFA